MSEVDRLLSILDKISETEKIILTEDEIESAIESKDFFLRMRVTEVMYLYPIDFARKILLKLLYDPIKNVRSNAAIDLDAGYYGPEAQKALIDRLLNDKDYLTRGWAADTLADEYAKHSQEDKQLIISVLEKRLENEKDFFVKANCSAGLYLLTQKEEFLSGLLDCYRCKRDLTRSATVNILKSIANKENASTIITFSKEALRKEKENYLVLKIKSLLEYCDELLY